MLQFSKTDRCLFGLVFSGVWQTTSTIRSNELQGQHRSYYGNVMFICKIATCGCYHDDKIFKGFIQIIFRFDLQIEYSVI